MIPVTEPAFDPVPPSEAKPPPPDRPGPGLAAVRPVDGGEPRTGPTLALRPVPAPESIPAKRCPDGHPNDPEATECRLCFGPIEAAASVVDLPPQGLARLLMEDGTAVELIENLSIGRCPPEHGPTDALTVSGRQVSRHHLAIEVRGWRLLIRDLGSTNGTFVTRRGERGRRRVPEDRSVPLQIGDSLHFGDRQALVVAPGS